MAVEQQSSKPSIHRMQPILLLGAGALLLLYSVIMASSAQKGPTLALLASGTVGVGAGTLLLVKRREVEVGVLESLAIAVTGGFVAHPLQELGYIFLSGVPLLLFGIIGGALALNSGIRALTPIRQR